MSLDTLSRSALMVRIETQEAALGNGDKLIGKLKIQIDLLATVLLKEFGGPTENESACEMAARVLWEQKEVLTQNKKDASRIEVLTLEAQKRNDADRMRFDELEETIAIGAKGVNALTDENEALITDGNALRNLLRTCLLCFHEVGSKPWKNGVRAEGSGIDEGAIQQQDFVDHLEVVVAGWEEAKAEPPAPPPAEAVAGQPGGPTENLDSLTNLFQGMAVQVGILEQDIKAVAEGVHKLEGKLQSEPNLRIQYQGEKPEEDQG